MSPSWREEVDPLERLLKGGGIQPLGEHVTLVRLSWFVTHLGWAGDVLYEHLV